MAGHVCVDASFAIKWILPEEFSEPADQLRTGWRRQAIALVAPALFGAEVTSVIRERAYRGEMSSREASQALEASLVWPVRLWRGNGELQRAAFDFAARFNQPQAYDAQYLALASILGCDLWTGDRRLARSVSQELSWVRWVGEYQPA